ncbi:MAG: hydroxymethylbilane synthase [Flavicella sp.]|nr:hydroxymethylbilane synthase [Flavicella sp.]
MNRTIKIGTRTSQLALWQARMVQSKLNAFGHATTLVEISSKGDDTLDKPLHEIGGMGLFTKTLDEAMLRGEIDIAVHSLKDVPTDLPDAIVQAAVLERATTHDVLVYKGSLDFLESVDGCIATGSLRRKAQWLHRYPTHQITGLRGNVNTRLQKLKDNLWNGAIFAMAGLERIDLLPKEHLVLDWMLPAPAQGAVMVAALEGDSDVFAACQQLNHSETALVVAVERQFMKTLEGGCTAPIGGCATIRGGQVHFKGVLTALDGSEQVLVEKTSALNASSHLGALCAQEVLDNGGRLLMERIQKEIKS